MNAEALYEIVKDIPQAWPVRCFYNRDEEVPGFVNSDSCGHDRIDPAHAVMLFEASAMRYLIGDHTCKTPIVRVFVYGTDRRIEVDGVPFIAPTLIQALAAAIKGEKR